MAATAMVEAQEAAVAEDGRSLLGNEAKPRQLTVPHVVNVAGIGAFYILCFAVLAMQRPRAGEPPIHLVQDWNLNQSVSLGSIGDCTVGAAHNTIQVGSIWERTATGVLRNVSVARRDEGAEEVQVRFDYQMVACGGGATPARWGEALRREHSFCDQRRQSKFHLQGWARPLDDRPTTSSDMTASVVFNVGQRTEGQGEVEHLLDSLLNRRAPECHHCALNAELLVRNTSWYPTAVALDAQGRLLVLDGHDQGCIWRAHLGTADWELVFGGHGAGNGTNQLKSPYGIVLDARGRLLVADTGNHRIMRVRVGTAHGQVVFGGHGAGSGTHQLTRPWGIALDAHGHLLIADYGNDRIMRVRVGAAHGQVAFGGQGRGSGLNQLSGPTYIALDAHGHLFVSERWNTRILRVHAGAARGQVVFGGQGGGTGLNQLSEPIGIVLDKHGRLLIADDNRRILRVHVGATRGELVFGGHGPRAWGQDTGLNQLSDLYGLALDKDGRMLIPDGRSGRVLRFHPDYACLDFDWQRLLQNSSGRLVHRTAGRRDMLTAHARLWVSSDFWRKLKFDAALSQSPLWLSEKSKASVALGSLKMPTTESRAWARKGIFVPALTAVLALSAAVHISGSKMGLRLALVSCGVLLVVSSAALELAATATTPPAALGIMLSGVKDAATTNGWLWCGQKFAAASVTILLPWAAVPLYLRTMGEDAPVSCAAGMLWEAHLHTLLGAAAASFAWALLLFERKEALAEKGVEISVPDLVARVVPALKGRSWQSSRPEPKRTVLFVLYLTVTNDWYNDCCFLLIGDHCQFRGTAVSVQILAVAVALQLVGCALLGCRALQTRRWRGSAALLLPPAWLEVLDEDLAAVSDSAAVVRCFTEDLTQGALQIWYVASVTSNVQILFSLATSLPPALLEASTALKRISSRSAAPGPPRDA